MNTSYVYKVKKMILISYNQKNKHYICKHFC